MRRPTRGSAYLPLAARTAGEVGLGPAEEAPRRRLTEQDHRLQDQADQRWLDQVADARVWLIVAVFAAINYFEFGRVD